MTKKNPLNKNQGWEPFRQKYKANENTSRHNLKRKQKQTINKNEVKTLCKDDYEMIINNNKKRPKMKELSFATNWLVTKVHSV
jgi:hypothetical protein